MYYFLAIVAGDDLDRWGICPSYSRCQSHGHTETRSGWRVVKQTQRDTFPNMGKVLVTSLIGNDTMIDFLRSYRTREHMHGDKRYDHEATKKYYPEGALFWFGCNRYGEPTGESVFIRRVPDEQRGKTDAGFERLRQAQARLPTLKELLCAEPGFDALETTHVKPKLVQKGSCL